MAATDAAQKSFTLKELKERAERRGDKPSLRLIAEIEKRDKTHKNKLYIGGGVPKVGEDIYVGTSMYIDHGEDDVAGGLAEVSKIEFSMSAGNPYTPFVTVVEHPKRSYNWELLRDRQDSLRKEFRKRRAYEDPDNG